MGEFMCGDDWDLEAVVRGYTSQSSSTAANLDIMECPFDSFTDAPYLMSSTYNQLDLGFSIDFPGFSETSMLLEDFDWAYGPSMTPDSSQTTPACSSSNTRAVNNEAGKIQEGAGSSAVCSPAHVDDAVYTTPKYKRRKNQHKQVVHHVSADDIVTSDPWAWRKYGQKPIKGSPYPRSYYRCSSSKGCPARKQVERSNSESGMFTLTYTGEHNHGHPTRRSALAGVNRSSRKFSASKDPTAVAASEELIVHEHKLPREIKVDHDERSPTASGTSTVEESSGKLTGTPVWGHEIREDDGKVLKLPSSSLAMAGEEIFMGFDELEGLDFDFSLNYC
ncbi:hypothetical protein SAY86_010638 [Trapa natans]|uniref:WRKY domain-containing protein n=1 Tax=Trapa natans TaxID=22666 RepID=A0AAN7LSL6_TRANT|nr:hypothetical protein SAY86_010638 [Trapa natans]